MINPALSRVLGNPIRDAIRKAIGAKFPPADPAMFQPGETLADATARRLGIKLADRPVVDPLDVPQRGRLVRSSDGDVFLYPTRDVRRARRSREQKLGSYSRRLFRKDDTA